MEGKIGEIEHCAIRVLGWWCDEILCAYIEIQCIYMHISDDRPIFTGVGMSYEPIFQHLLKNKHGCNFTYLICSHMDISEICIFSTITCILILCVNLGKYFDIQCDPKEGICTFLIPIV